MQDDQTFAAGSTPFGGGSTVFGGDAIAAARQGRDRDLSVLPFTLLAIAGFNADDLRAGWLRIELMADGHQDGVGFARIIEGQVGMPGEAITVGDSGSAAVPLPATLPLAGLGVLALGAAGLRRKRASAVA